MIARRHFQHAILTSVLSAIGMGSGWGRNAKECIVGKQAAPMGWETCRASHARSKSKSRLRRFQHGSGTFPETAEEGKV